MKKKKKRQENLLLMWKDSQGKPFKVGRLRKVKNRFYFKYFNEIINAIDEDEEFEALPKLPKVNVEYFSEELFRTFSDMIPVSRFKEEYQAYSDFERLKMNLKSLIDKEFYFEDENDKEVG